MKKEKWINIYIAILIILMVIGHTTTIFGGYIYTFHIASFFMICGYLFKDDSKENFILYAKRKFKSIMVPFILNSVALIIIAMIMSRFFNFFYSNPIDKNIFYLFIRYFNTVDLAGALWILPMLFLTEIGYKLLIDLLKTNKLKSNSINIWSMIICFIIALWGFTYYNNKEILPYYLDIVMLSILFFSCGYNFKRIESKISSILKNVVFVISILIIYIYNIKYWQFINWPTRTFPNIFTLLLISFAGAYIVYYISRLLSTISIKLKILKYIGDNALAILSYHFLGFRVLFGVLYAFSIVDINQTLSVVPLYSSTLYGICTAIFAIVFSLIFDKLIKIVYKKIFSLLMYITKKIKVFITSTYNKIKKLSKKEKVVIVISVFISLCQIALSFLFDRIIFIEQGNSDILIMKPWMYICKIVLFIILMLCWNKILLKKVNNFKFILVYLIIMISIFILVYPGIWRWDDIINLGSITNGYLYYWQHWLSSAYFYLCMCFIPTASGIIFMQIVIISIIVGHIIGNEYKRIGKKALFLYLPFLLPSVIDSNFYPMRANICAYIELYLFYELLNFNKNKHYNIKITFLMILTALLSVWRPENIVYIVIIPIMFVFIYKISIKKVAIIFSLSLLIMLMFMNIQSQGLNNAIRISSTGNKISEKELYTLSGFISPLGKLVEIAIDRNEFKEEIEEIDKIISVESICKNGGLGAFWGGGLKSLTPKQLNQLKKITIKMAFSYIPELIPERYDLFLSSNGYIENAQILLYGSAHIYNLDDIEIPDDIEAVYKEFQTRYIANKPLNAKVRRKVISMLEMRKVTDYDTSNKKLNMIFYNCTMAVIITCIIWIVALFKKKWSLALMIAALAAKFSIIVATAPMSAYMYYFSTHLICSFISFYVIIELISKAKFRIINHKSK